MRIKKPYNSTEISFEGDSVEGAQEIVKRIAYFESIEKELEDMKHLIKDSEQEKFIIFAYNELKRIHEKSLLDSEKVVSRFGTNFAKDISVE